MVVSSLEAWCIYEAVVTVTNHRGASESTQARCPENEQTDDAVPGVAENGL